MKETVELTTADHETASGQHGEALQFAMQVVLRAANMMQAPHLIDASFVHIDACHYYGTAHNDFAQYFVDHGLKFNIPAWTNTVPVSLCQPEIRIDANLTTLRESRELADLYVDLGANPVWTCAPYQLPGSPEFGQHVVGSESNAVAYFNSAVGARTNKYGDFLDVCAGLVGRVPFAGLHTDEGRLGEVLFDVSAVDAGLRETEIFCHVLGHLVGAQTGEAVPVINGLPTSTTADSLKAISAAGAASGGVALFHATGVTPEAPDLATAFGDRKPSREVVVTQEMLRQARDSLSSASAGPLNMVALGTPHFSITEFERLVRALDQRQIYDDLVFYVSTSRHVAGEARASGWLDELEACGVNVIVDTCTYFSPAVRAAKGRVMTNSAKWAYYAPGMLDVEVAFGSLEDCVESAVKGVVTRDESLWTRGN